jgi:hypothetical protein
LLSTKYVAGKGSKVTLRGSDDGCSQVKMKSTEETILFKPDFEDKGLVIEYFSSVKDINKICDYIIFTKHDSKVKVVLVELKGRNLGNAFEQIKAGIALASYILFNYSRVYNCTLQLENVYGIVFSNNSKYHRKSTIKGDNAFETHFVAGVSFKYGVFPCLANYDLSKVLS